MSDISKELSQKETSLLTRTAHGVDILVQRTDDERWYRDVELRAIVEVLRRIRWAVVERIVTAEILSNGQVVLTAGPSKAYQIGITGPWLKEAFEFADSTWCVVESGEEIEADPLEDGTIPANEVPSQPPSQGAEEPWILEARLIGRGLIEQNDGKRYIGNIDGDILTPDPRYDAFRSSFPHAGLPWPTQTPMPRFQASLELQGSRHEPACSRNGIVLGKLGWYPTPVNTIVWTFVLYPRNGRRQTELWGVDYNSDELELGAESDLSGEFDRDPWDSVFLGVCPGLIVTRLQALRLMELFFVFGDLQGPEERPYDITPGLLSERDWRAIFWLLEGMKDKIR